MLNKIVVYGKYHNFVYDLAKLSLNIFNYVVSCNLKRVCCNLDTSLSQK